MAKGLGDYLIIHIYLSTVAHDSTQVHLLDC